MRHLVRGRYSRTGAMSMTTPTTARRRGPQEPPVRLWVRRAKTGGGPVGQSLARHPVLSEMPTFDKESGDLRVVIETPKGSGNKYDYDPEYDCIELATVLPEGMIFPYDFGFLPSTLGEDGDPLDVLVLMDTSVVPGCVVRARHHRCVHQHQHVERITVLPQGRWQEAEIVGKDHPFRQDGGEFYTVVFRIVIILIAAAFRCLDHDPQVARFLVKGGHLGKHRMPRE